MDRLAQLRPAAIAALLIVFGAFRIATTWTTFSNTVDEPTHIAAGLELLQFHRYELQPENPPLPRIVLAAAPLAGGMRWTTEGNRFARFHILIYGHGDYKHNLVLMRVGNLFFFIVAGVALFGWARRETDERVAVLAVLLFTMQPIILGYAGLATLDSAAVAGLAVALVAFSAWLRRSTLARAALLGAAFAFSILCKFSCIGFVPAACLAIYVVRSMREPARQRERLRTLASIVVVPFAAFLTLWAGYGFTVGHLADLGGHRQQFGALDRLLFARLPPSMPLPAASFFRGIAELLSTDNRSSDLYLFGHVSKDGWWWYFPTSAALKTTLPFLALVVAGGVAAWRMPRHRWPLAEALAAAVAIIAVVMPSSRDIGVRYILPMYVPFSIAAAIGAAALLDSAPSGLRRTAIVLIALHVAASLAAHPDYFPYFNELAGGDPGRCLIDSNLDWGQDVLRLRRTIHERGIDRISLNLGWFDYDRLGFPPNGYVESTRPKQGWIAISEHLYRIEHAKGGWTWLDPYAMTRIGTSIRLYYVPRLPAAETTREEILLPIAGTVGVVGGPVGVWFHVDQTVRNMGRSQIRVVLSACGTNPAPCELNIEPQHTARLASRPGQRPFILVTIPPGMTKQLAFSTVVHAGNWPAVEIPAVSENAFQQDRVLIPTVPTNARLNLRVWLRASASGAPIIVRIHSPGNGRLIAEKQFAADNVGYFANGDLGQQFPELQGEPVDVQVESSGAKVWAMMTTTDYRSGRIVLSVPR
jgi:4-amino-4-deoxy-L-arabinose transferase and related glycosyltransferases of PMT family